MAARRNVKFVEQSNSHLICSVCNDVFINPVISVQCGHTFCRQCILSGDSESSSVKCPVDSQIIESKLLTINRALAGQIETLEVYCTHGLTWDETKSAYEIDPSGCSVTPTYGQREEHESLCDYSLIECQNNPEHCGTFRRRDVEQHLLVCAFVMCANKSKGCEFVSNREEVINHEDLCAYKDGGFVSLSDDNQNVELTLLLEDNKTLRNMVSTLSKRVDSLERTEQKLTEDMAKCTAAMDGMQKNYDELLNKLEKLFKPKRTTSINHKGAIQGIGRSNSSLYGATGPKVENWVLPFHFQCIGTLRGHKGSVWCLEMLGNFMFSSGSDKLIKIWDLSDITKGCTKTLTGHDHTVCAMAATEGFLYSSCLQNTLQCWKLDDFSRHTHVKNAHDKEIAAMVATDGHLFTASFEEIKVWSSGTLQLVKTIGSLYRWVRSLALNYARDRLYSGSHNTIEIWDTQGKFSMKAKIDHTYGTVHSIAITSKYIIAGTAASNIHVYDITSLLHVIELSAFKEQVTCLSVSPSGVYMFTGLANSSIRLWDLDNMLPIQTMSRHQGGVKALVLYGDSLYSGADESEMKVFQYIRKIT